MASLALRPISLRMLSASTFKLAETRARIIPVWATSAAAPPFSASDPGVVTWALTFFVIARPPQCHFLNCAPIVIQKQGRLRGVRSADAGRRRAPPALVHRPCPSGTGPGGQCRCGPSVLRRKGACRGSRSLHRSDSTGRAGFMGRGVLPSGSTRMREQARHVVWEFLGRHLLWEAAADPSARPRAGDPSRPMIGSVVVSRQEKDPVDGGGRLRLTGVNLLAAKGHRRVAWNWRHWCITSCLSSLNPSPKADTP